MSSYQMPQPQMSMQSMAPQPQMQPQQPPMPYSQGLVPAIQQMQLQPVDQLGAYNPAQPNPAQEAYLKSLQDTIKNQQNNTAQGLKVYGDVAKKSAEQKKPDGGGGFWGFVKAAAPLALAML